MYNFLSESYLEKQTLILTLKILVQRYHPNLTKIENSSEVAAHTCRRSFATNALHASADINDISYLMGHSSTRVTLLYLKLPNTEREILVQGKMIF